MKHRPVEVARHALAQLDPAATAFEQLGALAANADLVLPLPAAGRTLERWQVLSEVAAHDLSLAKLYEGHTDALAILHELGPAPVAQAGAADLADGWGRGGKRWIWGVWAAESPGGRVVLSNPGAGSVRLNGVKHWCSGAQVVTHALLTAWTADGRGPYLVRVDQRQAGVSINAGSWQALGMADSASVEVTFNDVVGEVVGDEGAYVSRRGFMQGGAGIAACWFGGAVALGAALHRAVADAPELGKIPFRSVGLGKVDMALSQTAALLRDTAAWIDQSPLADATVPALRARQSAEACARVVMDEVARALGATPFCRDRRFAKRMADLTVFTRQSLADRDFQWLGERLSAQPPRGWQLQTA